MNLDQFCSTEPNRQNLHKPFNYGVDEVAATNGHICIITKGRGVDPENPVDLKGVMDRLMLLDEIHKVDLSMIKGTPCKCEDEDRPCPCCKGTGTVEMNYDYTDYEFVYHDNYFDAPCPICEEWEEHNICRKCKGCKVTYEMKWMRIGTQSFDPHTLSTIKHLKNLTLQNGKGYSAARLYFDGGYGFLMPVREE